MYICSLGARDADAAARRCAQHTANLRTETLDFGGLDSGRILI